MELYQYFKTFRSPFKAYEADDPKSLEQAIQDINLKEKKPITYMELIPGKNYSPLLLIITLILATLLLGLKFLEVKSYK